MDAVAYLKDLVAFESPSYLSNVEVSNYVEETLQKLDFQTERLEYDDVHGVRKASIVGKKGEGVGALGYFGHTDVVPADDWLFEEHGPFNPTIKDGRLYGRGSCDMKGSVACMLAAAEQFAARDLKKAFYVTCTADEEVGYHGARQVAKESIYFREMVEGNVPGIIGEPTRLEVVHAHKGTYGIRVTSHGEAAHSSTREGLNANLAMIPFLVEMKKIHDETETDPAWQHEEFDPPTISWNIGINDHTRAINIKAPQSICTVYFRTMPGQNPELLLDRARKSAEENGLDLEVMAANGPLYVDPKSEMVQDLLQLLGKPKPRTVSYGTDGSVLTAMKNLIVLGPGDIAQAHTHDEWISLEQLEQGTATYSKLIQHWCC